MGSMARKNMWSATAAVGDAELQGLPEGYAPERDGTMELPRAMPDPSSGLYTVGRLGGAHRRNDKSGRPARPSRPAGDERSPKGGRSTEQTGEWTSIWPDEQPTVSRQAPQPKPQKSSPDDRWTTTTPTGRPDPRQGPAAYDRGPAAYDGGSSGYDRGPGGYDRGPAAYDAGPSGRGPAGRPVPTSPAGRPAPISPAPGARPVSSGRPTSGARTGGSRAAGGRRAGKPGSRRRPARPMRYTGARRKFSSWAPLGGGVLMLVLVLGATMLAESDRYTGNSSSALNSSAPASAPTAAANPPSAAKKNDAPAAEAVAAAINKELDNLGCGRVAVDQTLVAFAGDHVDDMLSRNYFNTKTPDGDTSIARAKSVGYDGKKVVESVVAGAGNPAEAARAAFPVPGDAGGGLPATVKAVSGGKLTCGWTAVGAEARMNTKSVAYWSIVLGQ